MKDSKGNKISIGDRVKVLWDFDNKIHNEGIINISDKFIYMNNFTRQVSLKGNTKIIPIRPKNNK
jgi:hypothetical protein